MIDVIFAAGGKSSGGIFLSAVFVLVLLLVLVAVLILLVLLLILLVLISVFHDRTPPDVHFCGIPRS